MLNEKLAEELKTLGINLNEYHQLFYNFEYGGSEKSYSGVSVNISISNSSMVYVHLSVNQTAFIQYTKDLNEVTDFKKEALTIEDYYRKFIRKALAFTKDVDLE